MYEIDRCLESPFWLPNEDSKLVEVGRVRFDYGKVCRRLVEVRRVGFDYLTVDMKLVEVGRVRFDYHKASRRLVEVRRGPLWQPQAYMKLVCHESFDPAEKLVRGNKFPEYWSGQTIFFLKILVPLWKYWSDLHHKWIPLAAVLCTRAVLLHYMEDSCN